MTAILQRLVLDAYRGIAALELNELSTVSASRVCGAPTAPLSSTGEALDPVAGQQQSEKLEDVLLALGDAAYPELAAAARGYADQWRQKADAEPTTPDWKDLRKPAGAKKVTIAAMTAVLKPGKSTQVSLEDNRWVSEHTKALACLQPSLAFLSALLTTPAPTATVPVQGSGEAP